jgi:hypothetical protein
MFVRILRAAIIGPLKMHVCSTGLQSVEYRLSEPTRQRIPQMAQGLS